MIVAIAALVQTLATPAVERAPEGFQQKLTQADWAVLLTKNRICGNAGNAKRYRELEVRVEAIEKRAWKLWDATPDVPLIEPSPAGPSCSRFSASAKSAAKALDILEAAMAAAEKN